MNRHFLPLSLGIAGIVLVLAAFGADNGDTVPADDADDGVVLGELDLAEQAEICRNQYRRMTPGDESLVQDVGKLPAAWEEFSSAWDAAPAVRDLATWLVPFSAELDGLMTVLRDSNGTILWSGTTDFAKPDSANVTLTGALVDELDWPLYDAARDEIESRLEAVSPMRGGPYTNGLRFTNAWVATNGDYHFDFAWESNGEVQVFCRAMHTTSWVETVVFTNDESEVVTNDFTHWRNVDGERFRGSPDTWDLSGVLTVTNGSGSFTDTNILEDYDKVRFYTAAQLADSDGDGLTDGEEWLISHSDPDLPDTDGDGIDDWTEYAAGASASASNVWWVVTISTNLFYREYIDDRPSWPNNAMSYGNWTWTFSSERPWSNAVVRDVTITGFVDDVIKVDGHEVDWHCGTTNYDHFSITNQIADLQSGQFVLSLLDWPEEGHSGPNEGRIGWTNTEPFVAEWTWWVPIEMRMEPIWTGSSLPLDNPSGVILHSNAWFHVDVWPDGIVPETNIVWTIQSNKFTFVTTNRGSRVQVRGDTLGEDELQVGIDGANGVLGLPPFHAKVVPLMLVTAKVGIVQANGVGAVDAAHVNQILSEANGILNQIGLQVILPPTITGIPDPGGFGELNLSSNQTMSALLGTLSQPDGLEIYFTHTITDNDGTSARGFNKRYQGIVMAAAGSCRTMAHEIGHACGLEDIYDAHVQTNKKVSGPVSADRVMDDWGNYKTDDWNELPMSNLVRRLMMFGHYNVQDKGDIPTGVCYGLGYQPIGGGYRSWELRDCMVGWPGLLTMPPNHNSFE